MVIPWFEWVTAHASEFDLICVTGDLMSLQGSADADPLPDPPAQAAFIARWLGALPTPVAICSGNHDLDEYLDIWKCQNPGNITIDLETRIVGEVVVTCLPFIFGFSTPESTVDAWIEGRNTADLDNLWWLILHHEPPGDLSKAVSVSQLMSDYRPDLFLCGHLHDLPRKKSFSFLHRWVVVLNPGVGADPLIPDRIVIDTQKKLATWYSGEEEWSTLIATTRRALRPNV